MNILDGGVIDKWLSIPEESKIYTGNYYPISMVGLCPIDIYLSKLNKKQYYMDDKLRFMYGNAFHHAIELMFIEKWPEAVIEWHGMPTMTISKTYGNVVLGGRPDIVINDVVIDLKIVNSLSDYLPKNADIQQLSIYMDILNISKGDLIYVDLDRIILHKLEGCLSRECRFTLDPMIVGFIADKINWIHKYVEMKQMPPKDNDYMMSSCPPWCYWHKNGMCVGR